MKYKIKIYGILLLCLFSLSIGCSKDDFEIIQNSTGSVTTARKISLQEFEQQTLPFQKYKETQSNIARAKTSRLLYNTKYGFTIDTDEIVYMEKDGKHSYTFPIHRDIDNGKVENYVLNEDASGEFQEFITKYTLTELEKQKIENHEPVNIDDKTEIARLSFLGPVNPCESVVLTIEKTYDANGHENGCIITYLIPKGCDGAGSVYQVYETMDSGGESGGGGTSGGTSGGGDWSWTGGFPGDNSGPSMPTNPNAPGGDGNGNGGIPTQTTPGGSNGDGTVTSSSGHHEYNPNTTTLLTQVVVSQDLSIAKELKEKDANPEFIAKLQELKTKAGTQNFESAYTLYQNAVDGLTFSDESTGSATNGDKGTSVTLEVSASQTQSVSNSIGFIHCHLDNGTTFKVFSISDLIGLADATTKSTRPTYELAVYVITASGTFVLKVNNRALLKSKKDMLQIAQNELERDFAKLVSIEASLEVQKLGFLKFINENKLLGGNPGIDLYQKDESSGVWYKLTLSSNSQTIIATPCN